MPKPLVFFFLNKTLPLLVPRICEEKMVRGVESRHVGLQIRAQPQRRELLFRLAV